MKRKTKDINIRLTAEELEHLKKCSTAFPYGKFQNGKENFSEYCRVKLLKESGYRNAVLEQNLREVRYELRKIGTNINQVTKKINSGFGLPGDVVTLQQQLDQIMQLVDSYEKEVKKIGDNEANEYQGGNELRL